MSLGAQRGIVREPLGRAAPLVLGAFALIVAASLGIPFGELIHWFTEGSRAALATASANVSRLVPATVTSVAIGAVAAIVAVRWRCRWHCWLRVTEAGW